MFRVFLPIIYCNNHFCFIISPSVSLRDSPTGMNSANIITKILYNNTLVIERRSVTSRYHGSKILDHNNGSLNNDDSGSKKNGKKAISLNSNNQLCRCIKLFCPPFSHCYTTKRPNFTRPFYKVSEHNTIFFFF